MNISVFLISNESTAIALKFIFSPLENLRIQAGGSNNKYIPHIYIKLSNSGPPLKFHSPFCI